MSIISAGVKIVLTKLIVLTESYTDENVVDKYSKKRLNAIKNVVAIANARPPIITEIVNVVNDLTSS